MRIYPISQKFFTLKGTQNVSQSESLNKSNGVKVSVIMPIYNQEKYLEKSLTSLKNQTLKDIEFICVNDGSNDNSLKILEDFAREDKRFKIINQQNQGCGAAKNNGIKAAQGEYIAFLDPDDWFESNALESLYKKAKNQDCDMLVFNFNRVKDSGDLLGQYNLKKRLQRFYDIKEEETFTWRDVKPRVLGGLHPAAWNKLYKHDLLKDNEIEFTKCNLAEDNAFVFGASLTAENIGYSDGYYYNYVIHDGSAIRSKSDKNLCIFEVFENVKNLINKLGLMPDLKDEFDGYILRFASYHRIQIESMSKFWEACQKYLSPEQTAKLLERYKANQKVSSIVESLLAAKRGIK